MALWPSARRVSKMISAVCEFERVVVHHRLLKRDLAETRYPLADPALRDQRKVRFGLSLVVERNFCPGKQANRDGGVADFGRWAAPTASASSIMVNN